MRLRPGRIRCHSASSVAFVFAALSCLQMAVADDDPFVMPELLKPNVEFWERIYTQISVSEGLFHDRDYPRVVYRRAPAGEFGTRARREALRVVENEIRSALENVISKSPEEWTAEEKRIKELFDKYAPPGALNGAASRIRFQQGQRERFIEGLERSGMYLDTIRAILSKYGLPLKLAYLPHVESSFDVNAYSKVGAAGLWQFMRSTAKTYGLRVDYLVDERRDPVRSTDAAARLLLFSYNELQSWPLAITSYNHGLAGIKRAVMTTGSRDIEVIISRHESPSFKFASKNFYSCFLAACRIAERPENYVGVVAMHAPARWNDVTLTHHVRPSVLAHYLGIPEQLLRALNPALRPVVFQHEKLIPAGYVLHIPSALESDAARERLAMIPDSLRSDRPERPQYYRVARGENLYSIAERLGVPAEDLAAENAISRSNRIYAGQVLRVPSVSLRQRMAARSTKPSAVDTTQASPAVAVPAPAETTAHVVIVASVPTPSSVDSLRELIMTPADTLPVIPRPSPALSSRFDVSIYNLETVVESPSIAQIRVAINETLGHYAEWLGIPTFRLRALNRMHGRSDIRVGQTLLIPLDADDALERFTKTRLEYHLANEEDFYGRFMVTDVRQRPVRRGETLWEICSAEGEIPLWLFKKYNRHLDLERLVPGTPIWIPVISERSPEDMALGELEDSGKMPAFWEPLVPRAGFTGLLP